MKLLKSSQGYVIQFSSEYPNGKYTLSLLQRFEINICF